MGTSSIEQNLENKRISKKKEVKNYNNDENKNLEKKFNTNKPQQNYQQNMLECHNKYRKRHCAHNINLINELSHMAKEYAIKLLESNSNFEQTNFYNGEILGENIFFSDKKENEEYICKYWYDENSKYNYEKNSFQKNTNHFTQIVWNSTTEVGFGYCGVGEKFCYVALYFPQGNIFGKFRENVKKAK